jgi:hypothetical protein
MSTDTEPRERPQDRLRRIVEAANVELQKIDPTYHLRVVPGPPEPERLETVRSVFGPKVTYEVAVLSLQHKLMHIELRRFFGNDQLTLVTLSSELNCPGKYKTVPAKLLHELWRFIQPTVNFGTTYDAVNDLVTIDRVETGLCLENSNGGHLINAVVWLLQTEDKVSSAIAEWDRQERATREQAQQ